MVTRGQIIAMTIIKTPDVINQWFTPTLSANNPERIRPTGMAKDMMLPVSENTRPKYSGLIFS